MQSCNDKTKTDSDTKKESVVVDVPAGVKSAFTVKYPDAVDILWEDAKENDKKTYKAKFTYNGKKLKAEFDEAGNFIKEEND